MLKLSVDLSESSSYDFSESIEETGDGQTSVKACRLSLAMEITLTPEDVRIMKQYTERFTSIGRLLSYYM